MTQQTVSIQGNEYNLITDYQNNSELRTKLNHMTQSFWGFDFEKYYASGYWKEDCKIFSLFKGREIVAHTTVTFFNTADNGQNKILAQIGTVMTNPKFQKRGLARYLMEYILEQFQDQVNGFFLFANSTVLDFYPKFGLSAVKEFQPILELDQVNCPIISTAVRKLNLADKTDLELFENYVNQGVATSTLDTKNQGLPYFYCYTYPQFGFRESIYWIESLETIAIVETDQQLLTIFQLFQLHQKPLNQVIAALIGPNTRTVKLGFSPLHNSSIPFAFHPYQEDDLILFVSAPLIGLFEQQKIMISMLSHT